MTYTRTRAVLRPYTTALAHDAINRRSCLHIDAWLYQDDDNRYYFCIEYSAGGKQTFKREAFAADWTPANDWELVPVAFPDTRNMAQKFIDGPTARVKTPWLERLHKILMNVYHGWHGDAFKGYRSISLWYVYSDGRISDPFAGLNNMYGETFRAVRDDAMMKNPPIRTPQPRSVTAKRTPAKLDKAERSIMRTLDKLL